jgi:hypothetical protein
MYIWYDLRLFAIFFVHLLHFLDIWSILVNFGQFCPVLVCCSKKNLATLLIWAVDFATAAYETSSVLVGAPLGQHLEQVLLIRHEV